MNFKIGNGELITEIEKDLIFTVPNAALKQLPPFSTTAIFIS